MKRIVLGGILCSVLLAYEGKSQTLGFGFEFFNQPNMLSTLIGEDYGEGSLSDLFSIVAPTILCDINLGNVLKIEPQLGILVGDGAGDNGMVLNGGLGVFGLHDPMDEILIYYGGRGRGAPLGDRGPFDSADVLVRHGEYRRRADYRRTSQRWSRGGARLQFPAGGRRAVCRG